MEFSRQKYWSGLPFPSPEDLPDTGIKPVSPVSSALQSDSLPADPSSCLIWALGGLSAQGGVGIGWGTPSLTTLLPP